MLTKPYIYLAGIVTSLLMIPHLMWHIEHNFPTFQYHLVDRSEDFKFQIFPRISTESVCGFQSVYFNSFCDFTF